MTALQHLKSLSEQNKATAHPNFPIRYIPKSKYSDQDANGLTRCIVDYFNLSGHFATRLASTGTYRNDLRKFVPSQQRTGLPDVFAIVSGRAVFVEVKTGKDRLSQEQEQAIEELGRAGAYVFIASTFQSFYDWFTGQCLTENFA